MVKLDPRPQWLTFDCYGTLIDWEAGIRSYFAALPGVTDPEPLLAEWEEIQFHMIAGGYKPYRGILAASLRETLHARGLPAAPEKEADFAEALTHWTPFPDTNPALEKFRAAGLKLGIISNVDDHLLARTVRHFIVSFDLLVTAQQSGAYKPDSASFRLALERIGLPAREVCHVAFGDRYDLATARRCGMQVVFVNRHRKRIPFQADAEVESLSVLAAALSPPRHQARQVQT
jgi:2-haloalkanoic acid dehalogenase type II